MAHSLNPRNVNVKDSGTTRYNILCKIIKANGIPLAISRFPAPNLQIRRRWISIVSSKPVNNSCIQQSEYLTPLVFDTLAGKFAGEKYMNIAIRCSVWDTLCRQVCRRLFNLENMSLAFHLFPTSGISERAATVGFRFGARGTHTSRTIMLTELSAVLAVTPDGASREDYAAAIIEGNCLGKATAATRRLTNQRLGELYGLDSRMPLPFLRCRPGKNYGATRSKPRCELLSKSGSTMRRWTR